MVTPKSETESSCPKSEINDENITSQIAQKAYEQILPTLPIGKGWMSEHLVLYQGFWLTPHFALKAVVSIQKNHFLHPQTCDVFLASSPKTGTTWLKAIIFATMNRTHDFSSTNHHPLLVQNPHDCIPFFETHIQQNNHESSSPSPRLFSTHIPYTLLPQSMTTCESSSGCKYVYVCRNPKDTFVSKWKFMNKERPKHLAPLSLEEAFELFCDGVSHYGPYWDHVLGYWKASVDTPERILFLKYEDLKRDPLEGVRRVGEFLGKPFSVEEEKAGVVEGIVRLCSFENLRNLEVNKSGVMRFGKDIVVDNRNLFRKGEVGDSKNYLTVEMMDRLDRITEKKFSGFGFTFGG